MTGILDTIDGALSDYAASGDAMRWVPEEKRLAARPPAAVLPAFSLDTAALTRMMDQVAEGLRQFFAEVGTAVAPLIAVLGTIAKADAQHEERRRGGGKLAVDGHAYQRRLRARRRRKRRP